MFTATFWATIVPALGSEALRPQVASGVRLYSTEDFDLMHWFNPLPHDAGYFDGVPEGWCPGVDPWNAHRLESNVGDDFEGLGRLMRINCEGIWHDDARYAAASKESRSDSPLEDAKASHSN